MGLDEVIGVGVFAVALVVFAWSALLTLRFRSDGSLLEAMAQVTFLPEKRRTYLLLLAIEGNLILDAGLVWGLGVAGVLPAWFVEPLLGLFLAGAAASVGAVTWLGLRPRRLSEGERVALRTNAPAMLNSLAFAAYAAADGDEPAP
jgi:hypothetical protein